MPSKPDLWIFIRLQEVRHVNSLYSRLRNIDSEPLTSGNEVDLNRVPYISDTSPLYGDYPTFSPDPYICRTWLER